MAQILSTNLHQLARHLHVGGGEHGISQHHEQADIESHQRPDGMLGLGILAARRRNSRGDLGIDHRHAGIEKAGNEAGDQRAKGPAFAHAVIPAHEFADQHDADTQRPDMDGTQHFQKIDRLRGGAGAHGDIGHGLFSRLGGE